MQRQFIHGAILAIAAVVMAASVEAGEPGVKTPLLIGMPESLLVDASDAIDVIEDKLATLMKEFTGLQGKLKTEKDAFTLARKLETKELQLGVFQGIEFAWAQKKHPKLKPLMAAASDDKDKQYLHTLLMVRADSKVKSAAELKGKDLALPKKSKEHVSLFLERVAGGAAKDFFKSVGSPVSVEAALDDLAAGKVEAVVADKGGAEFYRFLKPGAYAKLRLLETSPAFPASVIAYLEGGLDAKTIDRIQQGMLKANKSERGQDLMSTWGIVSFEPVFKNYQADLDAILKSFPTPAKTSAK